MRHNQWMCPIYRDEVLPDEKGNCSLCGATIIEMTTREIVTETIDGMIGLAMAQSEVTSGDAPPEWVDEMDEVTDKLIDLVDRLIQQNIEETR